METSIMKPQDEIAVLRKENAELIERNKGLLQRVEELKAQKPKSKSRQQAEAGLEMLQKGPVSLAQFTTLNSKYPGDVAYYIRNLLKIDVKTVRTAAGSLYMLKEHFDVYQAGLKKEKEAAKEAA